MANTWIKPLAKAAGITDAGVYYSMKRAGRKAPYSEYEVLTVLRGRGRKCTGYKPVADAVGKPLPPLGEKKKQGSWNETRPLNRLAALLPGGASVNNKTRVRSWLKRAGITDFKKLDQKKALEVLAGRGIKTEKFEDAAGDSTPKLGNGNGSLMEEPARSRSEIIAQFAALREQLKAAQATIDHCNAAMREKDSKIADLVQKKKTVRIMLQQFESQIIDVAKKHFGGLRRPLTYPIQALDEIRED